jgi:AbiV family abortive infection protein
MRKVTKAIRRTLQLARKKIITNAWQLLRTAVKLFEQEQYAIACFLAMTTIEEVGKLFILQLIQGDVFKGLGIKLKPPPELNTKELNEFLRSHLDKALEAAASSLYINAGADRRHGVHPVSGIHHTSGVVLLARSGYWMNIRNSCLYTEVDFIANLTSSPNDVIIREHAYYFICMGFEVLAEQAEAGFGASLEGSDVSRSHQFWQDRLKDLERFMEQWSSTVNLDRLDFLANLELLRNEAEKCESKNVKKKEKAFVRRNVT